MFLIVKTFHCTFNIVHSIPFQVKMDYFLTEVRKLLFILWLVDVALADSVIVNTPSGIVIGSEVYHNGTSVKRFLGIPFAEPPVGNLRFRKPVPVTSWPNPIIADTMPPSCLQYYPFYYPWVDTLPGKSEDCLYLNIWVPESDILNRPKAVLFWIFSGGFNTGSNREPVYDGYVLAAEGDVIVVTVNYRLGIFGFLSTESEEAKGNAGLFDVLEALKWVHQNIEGFGGDKNRITILGQSAGSVTSSFLSVSPLARGLFRSAILESGSALLMNEAAKKSNLQLGQKVAEAVGCASKSFTIETNPQEVVQCLRTINGEILVNVVYSLKLTSVVTFRPIYGDQFLPVKPYEAIKNRDFQNIDVVIGNVADEGSFRLISAYPDIFGTYGEKNPIINKTYGRDLIVGILGDLEKSDEVANYYLFGLQEYDYNVIRSQVYHSYGDFAAFCPDLYLAELLSQAENNVYFYYYTHQSFNTVFSPWMGVTHFSEVPFVFGRPLDNPAANYTVEEKMFSKRIIQLWTNFAKYGVPSSTWKKFSTSDYYAELLQIYENDDNYYISHLYNCEFWRKYFKF